MPGSTDGLGVPTSTPTSEPDILALELAELPKIRNSDFGRRLVDMSKSWTLKCQSSRNPEQLRWYRNLAMYENQQDAKLGGEGSLAQDRLFIPPVPRGQKKYKINRIKPIVRTEIARFVAQKPGFTAIPASSEDRDLAAAKAAEQILESQFHRRHMDKVFQEAAFWLSVAGNAFIKTYWDGSSYDTYSRMAGDIIYSNVSPFNILVPDLRATEIEHQPYVIHQYTRDMEWLYHFFGERLQGINLKPSAVSANSIMDEAYYKLRGTKESQLDACMVYEIWVKPGATRLMPQGGLVTLVDDHIMQFQEGLPYNHGEYPFAHFTHVPSASFYASSVIPDLEPLALEYTDLRNQVARSRERMAKPQLLAPKGAISASKMTNEIGLVIEYRPGLQPPQPMPMAQLPQYLFEEQASILTDMEDISGQHQVSKGNTPPGVTAATAIGFLQEKDDSFIAPTYGSIEFGFEKLGRHTLSLAQQYWNIPRTIKVVGEDNTFDVLMFASSDLVAGTDIRVDAGSSLPQSKAAKQALITDWMNMGHISSEDGLAMLDIGGAQKIVDILQIDKRAAMRENLALRHLSDEQIDAFDAKWQEMAAINSPDAIDADTGLPLQPPPVIPVNTWDNHEVHIEIHNRFRKSQAFPMLSERVREAFEAHVQAHQMAMQGMMLEQAMNQIPSDGTDPTAPDSGNPLGSLGGGEEPPEGGPELDTGAEPPTTGVPQGDTGVL